MRLVAGTWAIGSCGALLARLLPATTIEETDKSQQEPSDPH
jgi:hypothetical protein